MALLNVILSSSILQYLFHSFLSFLIKLSLSRIANLVAAVLSATASVAAALVAAASVATASVTAASVATGSIATSPIGMTVLTDVAEGGVGGFSEGFWVSLESWVLLRLALVCEERDGDPDQSAAAAEAEQR